MKKTFKIKSLITALCAILVVVSLVFTLTACGDDKTDVPTTEPTSTEAPVSTTETVKPIEDETTTETETTTEEAVETEAPTTQSSGSSGGSYAPETTKKPATTSAPQTTKAPETTKKQESNNKVNQFDDIEVKDKDREEPPTTPSGAFDMGAMNEASKEENGGTVYF